MRNRLIVTGTAAAFVLTAGIVGAVAVQPAGTDLDRETSAGPASAPDALQGLPPMLLKREPASGPGEKGTVDVQSGPQQPNRFTYTPPPASTYTPRHMAVPSPDLPGSGFTNAPVPGVDIGNGSGTSTPGRPPADSVRPPTYPPANPPANPPAQSPQPTPTPTPTPDPTPTPTPTPDPTPTPTPTPEPTDPPSEEPTDPPSQEPTDPPPAEPSPDPSENPSPDPSTEPSPEPSTEPTE
ncbi:hypothetical protein [Promicromonospora iranensis]|uniref:Uncharacterized protein n=1 Tax=Promicromonospora iranensis TaxID=1105144 RepID=A0ABU2CP90_9MICO|nr:hypothetical protein [Promicromonospora iranensis]MDR7383152.1 hypothetical protein [Promicromonospora iranensis]